MNTTQKAWRTELCAFVFACVFAGAVTILMTGSAIADTMTSTNYKISWDVADGGGASMSSTNYDLIDSAAQPSAVGAASSANYMVQGGFHAPPDADFDRVKDFMDNCTYDLNTSQYDSDGDGYGNLCDPDLDNNLTVNFLDYSILTSAFLSTPGDAHWNADADLTGDNVVNFIDISLFQFFFLQPPGPSGIAP